VLAGDDAVPGFGAGHAGEVSAEGAVVFAGKEEHLYGHVLLAEGAVHLFGLAVGIGGVALALE